jgi:hypothetical protein
VLVSVSIPGIEIQLNRTADAPCANAAFYTNATSYTTGVTAGFGKLICHGLETAFAAIGEIL